MSNVRFIPEGLRHLYVLHPLGMVSRDELAMDIRFGLLRIPLDDNAVCREDLSDRQL